MDNIFVTSDPHYGHANIIRYCNRPFINVEEMDYSLINNWNSVVDDNDTVIVNGDFMFYKNDTGIFNRLKGKKILVKGNHDKKAVFSLGWESMHDIYDFSYLGKHFVMCHYPIAQWNNRGHGSLHLYGHIHDEQNAKVEVIPNRYNICVEMTNYFPVNLETYLGV